MLLGSNIPAPIPYEAGSTVDAAGSHQIPFLPLVGCLARQNTRQLAPGEKHACLCRKNNARWLDATSRSL